MSGAADLYKVLQVDSEADSDVIQAAYRRLAQRFHPDVTQGDPALTEKMRAINRAWEVLRDPSRRSAYDLERRDAAAAPAHARPSPYPAARSSSVGRPMPVDPNHAGPPPGHPSGSVLNFGRYAGWSLGEIARHDLDYVEWLQRSTHGRRLRAEIDFLLAGHRGSRSAGHPASGSGWSGRR
jgi:curved DNA-binding protein CbpA